VVFLLVIYYKPLIKHSKVLMNSKNSFLMQAKPDSAVAGLGFAWIIKELIILTLYGML